MSQKLKSIIWKTPKGVFKKMSSRNIPALVTIPGRSSRNMTPLPCWCNSGTERMARLSANCSLGDQWYSQVAAKAQVERGKTILWISPFKKSFKQRHEWKECQDWICRWLQCQGTFLWKPIKMWLSPVFPGCITSPWWVFAAQTSRCRRAHLLTSVLFSTALAEQHCCFLQPQAAPTEPKAWVASPLWLPQPLPAPLPTIPMRLINLADPFLDLSIQSSHTGMCQHLTALCST